MYANLENGSVYLTYKLQTFVYCNVLLLLKEELNHRINLLVRQGNKQKKQAKLIGIGIRQTLVYITKPLASTSSHSPSVENNYHSNVHAYFTFLLPLDVLFHVHWLKKTRTIQSVWWPLHFTTSHVNVTSYTAEYFVIPHQLRFPNSLSNWPTSFILHAYGWPPYHCATQFVKSLRT